MAKNLPVDPWLCSQTPGKVSAKFIVGKFFTMSQSFSMKTRFMPESALSRITHYVRSIPITLSVHRSIKFNNSKCRLIMWAVNQYDLAFSCIITFFLTCAIINNYLFFFCKWFFLNVQSIVLNCRYKQKLLTYSEAFNHSTYLLRVHSTHTVKERT